jgi:hypothetical protein
VDASRDNRSTAEDNQRTAERESGIGRLRQIAQILIVNVAVPLAVYGLLRSAGMPTVSALLLSGVFPALSVTVGIIRHRRLDVVGALVLFGIAVGTLAGLITHSARLVLLQGSVPTAVFGVACLGSLWTRRPLMFGLALEFTGPDTAKGREMTELWQYQEFRRIFRVITAVWGTGFLLEAAARVVIVYSTSTGTALASSNVTPLLWLAALSAWTFAYGARQKKKGERLAASETAQSSSALEPPPEHQGE